VKKLKPILIPKKASMKMSVHMCRLVLAGILLMSCAGYMQAQTPISLYNSFSGLVNYTVIGGSLRTSSNAVNACAVGASGSSTLNVPVGSTIVGAYLYWAGSGSTSDYTVNLDAQVYTAPVCRCYGLCRRERKRVVYIFRSDRQYSQSMVLKPKRMRGLGHGCDLPECQRTPAYD
jgi:hypothetical protein